MKTQLEHAKSGTQTEEMREVAEKERINQKSTELKLI